MSDHSLQASDSGSLSSGTLFQQASAAAAVDQKQHDKLKNAFQDLLQGTETRIVSFLKEETKKLRSGQHAIAESQTALLAFLQKQKPIESTLVDLNSPTYLVNGRNSLNSTETYNQQHGTRSPGRRSLASDEDYQNHGRTSLTSTEVGQPVLSPSSNGVRPPRLRRRSGTDSSLQTAGSDAVNSDIDTEAQFDDLHDMEEYEGIVGLPDAGRNLMGNRRIGAAQPHLVLPPSQFAGRLPQEEAGLVQTLQLPETVSRADSGNISNIASEVSSQLAEKKRVQGLRSDTTKSSIREVQSLTSLTSSAAIKDNTTVATYELLPLWQDVSKIQLHGASARNASVYVIAQQLSSPDFRKNSMFTSSGIGLGNLATNPMSHHRLMWEFVGVICIAYDLIMAPLAAFGIKRDSHAIYFIVVYWTLDVACSFFVGYYVNGFLELHFTKMAKHYLRTWFIPDMLLVACDWLLLEGIDEEAVGKDRSLQQLSQFVRLLRFLRLIRLLKLNTYLNKLLEAIQSDYVLTFVNVFRVVVVIVIVGHLVACGFYGIGELTRDQEDNWVDYTFEESHGFSYRYLTSLHWSITQSLGRFFLQCL